MNEIERFNNKSKDFETQILIQEEKINEAKGRIRCLKIERDNHVNSCKHKFDDGSSAFLNSSYWVSDISYVTNDWTGEIEQYDDGYTQYEKTCQICEKQIEL